MHCVGGALLDPKTVRTERHWFVRYMATIFGHFTIVTILIVLKGKPLLPF
jgi:hypothetical protein